MLVTVGTVCVSSVAWGEATLVETGGTIAVCGDAVLAVETGEVFSRGVGAVGELLVGRGVVLVGCGDSPPVGKGEGAIVGIKIKVGGGGVGITVAIGTIVLGIIV